MVTHLNDWTHANYREIQNPPKRYGIIDLWGVKFVMWLCWRHRFQQATAEPVVAAFALENSRILSLEQFGLSVAIERVERFEPTVVGGKRSQLASELCSKGEERTRILVFSADPGKLEIQN